eukprot:6092360-Ditylum_brightwellii.AAC.1
MTAGGALLMTKAISTWDSAPDAPGYLAVRQCQLPTVSVEASAEVMVVMEGLPFPLKVLVITNFHLFTHTEIWFTLVEVTVEHPSAYTALMNHFLTTCPNNIGNIVFTPFLISHSHEGVTHNCMQDKEDSEGVQDVEQETKYTINNS